jgi:hypothetical protein
MIFITLGKLLQDENQTLEQCRFNDYDLVTCQRSRRMSSCLFSEIKCRREIVFL